MLGDPEAPETPPGVCKNCGAAAPSRYCPECGQNTKTGIPSIWELLHDGFGALFSYDSKLWRTLGTMIAKPGELTLAYTQGRRARYLTPLQLFVWLETVAFVSDRLFFDQDARIGDQKQRELVLLGFSLAVLLAIVYPRRKLGFVVHLITAVHVWSFLMLLLLFEYAVVPWGARAIEMLHLVNGGLSIGHFVTWSVQALMLVYTILTLKRIHERSWIVAALKAILLFAGYIGLEMVLQRVTGQS